MTNREMLKVLIVAIDKYSRDQIGSSSNKDDPGLRDTLKKLLAVLENGYGSYDGTSLVDINGKVK